MDSQNTTQTNTNNPTEYALDFVEFVKNIAIVGDVDWDSLTPEKQQDMVIKMQKVIAEHLDNFMDQYATKEVKDDYQEGKEQGLTPEYIESKPDLANLLDTAMRSLIQGYLDKTEVDDILNSLFEGYV